jgi:hypothetical protein
VPANSDLNVLNTLNLRVDPSSHAAALASPMLTKALEDAVARSLARQNDGLPQCSVRVRAIRPDADAGVVEVDYQVKPFLVSSACLGDVATQLLQASEDMLGSEKQQRAFLGDVVTSAEAAVARAKENGNGGADDGVVEAAQAISHVTQGALSGGESDDGDEEDEYDYDDDLNFGEKSSPRGDAKKEKKRKKKKHRKDKHRRGAAQGPQLLVTPQLEKKHVLVQGSFKTGPVNQVRVCGCTCACADAHVVHVCACLWGCVRARVCACACVRACVCVHARLFIRSFVRACMRSARAVPTNTTITHHPPPGPAGLWRSAARHVSRAPRPSGPRQGGWACQRRAHHGLLRRRQWRRQLQLRSPRGGQERWRGRRGGSCLRGGTQRAMGNRQQGATRGNS